MPIPAHPHPCGLGVLPSPPQLSAQWDHGVKQPLVWAPKLEPPQERNSPKFRPCCSLWDSCPRGQYPKKVDPRRSPQVSRCTPKFWGSGRGRISPDQGSHCIPRIPKSIQGDQTDETSELEAGDPFFKKKNPTNPPKIKGMTYPCAPTHLHRAGGRRSSWARSSVESQPFPNILKDGDDTTPFPAAQTMEIPLFPGFGCIPPSKLWDLSPQTGQ